MRWILLLLLLGTPVVAEPSPAKVGEMESRAQLNGDSLVFSFANRSRRAQHISLPQGTPMASTAGGSGQVFLGQAVEVNLKPGETRQVTVAGIAVGNCPPGAYQPSSDRKLAPEFKTCRDVMKKVEAGQIQGGPAAARFVLLSGRVGVDQAQAELTRQLGPDQASRLRQQLASAGLVSGSGKTLPPPATPQKLFMVGNTEGVLNGPTAPTVFQTNRPVTITRIQNYHWNNARGAPGGTIGLRDQRGRLYGPWKVTTESGYRGAPNVLWNCQPNLSLPAGSYTVIDSDPGTWSHNAASGGRGFVEVQGVPTP